MQKIEVLQSLHFIARNFCTCTFLSFWIYRNCTVPFSETLLPCPWFGFVQWKLAEISRLWFSWRAYTSTRLVKHRDIIDGRQFPFSGKSAAFHFWFVEKVWSKPLYIFVYWNNGLLVSPHEWSFSALWHAIQSVTHKYIMHWKLSRFLNRWEKN